LRPRWAPWMVAAAKPLPPAPDSCHKNALTASQGSLLKRAAAFSVRYRRWRRSTALRSLTLSAWRRPRRSGWVWACLRLRPQLPAGFLGWTRVFPEGGGSRGGACTHTRRALHVLLPRRRRRPRLMRMRRQTWWWTGTRWALLFVHLCLCV
jgi:hypothetical protein